MAFLPAPRTVPAAGRRMVTVDTLGATGWQAASGTRCLRFLLATPNHDEVTQAVAHHLQPQPLGEFLLARGVLEFVQRAHRLATGVDNHVVGSDTRTGGRSLINQGETLSSQAATWLGSSTGKTAVSVVLALLGALAVWALWRWFFRVAQPNDDAVAPITTREVAESERSQHGPASTRA